MTTKTQARMTTDATAKSAPQTMASAFDTEALSHINDRNLEAAMRMGHAMFDSAATMNQEFLNFVNKRLQEDMKTAQSLCDCRHPTEFVDAELKFLQTLVQQYAENANKLLGIASDVMRTGAHDVEEAVTELTKTTENDAA